MSLANAQNESFVDFYELLGMGHDASTIQLRSRINEMFGEAQANRDHRNLEKREEFQALLHWLPVCRAVLLHEGRRAKYDGYVSTSQGRTLADFNAFISGLTGAADVLPGADAPLGVKPRSTNTLSPDATRAETSPRSGLDYRTSNGTVNGTANGVSAPKSGTPVTHATPAALSPAPAERPAKFKAEKPLPTALTNPILRRELMSLLSSAAGVVTVFVVFILARAVLHLDFFICAIPAFVAGALVWGGLSATLTNEKARLEDAP